MSKLITFCAALLGSLGEDSTEGSYRYFGVRG